MAEDVWTALVKGTLAFGQTRAAGFVADAFKDTGSFVAALAEDPVAKTPDTKSRFETLKQDIADANDAAQPVITAIEPKITLAQQAIARMVTELATNPFTIEAAARAATELSVVLRAVDEALLIVADEISSDKDGKNPDPVIRNAIAGMAEPWKRPFRNLGAGTKTAFDDVAKQLLGVDNASQRFADLVRFDRPQKLLEIRFANTGRKTLGLSLAIEQAELFAFLSYAQDAVVGIKLNTKLSAGLRADKLVEQVIPGGADPEAESSLITLDSDRGLSFGEGKNRKLTLPVRFSAPGVELREFAIGLPGDESEAGDRLEVTGTIAGKIGDVLGAVVEGAGVTIRWQDDGSNHLTIQPHLPTGLGVRVDAGIVAGGGFIQRIGNEYSGILDLRVGGIRITAIALLVTEPDFSFVTLLAIHFAPAIELSFGFTLNGLGGLLALNRRIATDELRKGIRDGTSATLLFPEKPIDAAKTILDKVRAVFPEEQGSFAVGPLAELGWGSQAGFVVAKVGLLLGLPDPKIILLGAVQVGVPSALVDEKLRIVDMRAEVYGEFTSESILFLVGLNNSRLGTMPLSGDLGLFIRWAGGADFALSAGGFFPGFPAPSELASMRRIRINQSPSKILEIYVDAYFAITPNSIQFGGGYHLHADVGVAEGSAWVTLDALFKWAPRFYFEVQIDAGFAISALGHDFANVDFHGTLKGTTPWYIDGTATIDVWYLPTIHFDIGPFQWGEEDTADQPTLSPLTIVADALDRDIAWTPQLPAGADTIARFIRDEETPLLVHPLGMLEVKQLQVPLETRLDRIGSAKPTATRVFIDTPMVHSEAVSVASTALDQFALGHFQELSDEAQLSTPPFVTMPAGMRLAATEAPVSGAPTSVPYVWETRFPLEEELAGQRFLHAAIFSERMTGLSVRTNAVSVADRLHRNPYLGDPEPIELRDSSLRTVGQRDNLSRVNGAAEP
ncbi:MAG TPA: DUF6603 domain-containing protein, partial [Chthoniobacterales bacterium]|nr:DUF6603 domain-containing protein [Chthoniobacterales bacterium]